LSKFWLLCVLSLLSLSACEKQKQASAEVGAIPKQILDKATSDINTASAIAEEQLKTVEGLDAPVVENVQK
jgi:hypothetical protein